MKVIVVIPARYGSTRFEGKVLARDTGKYLVEHTWQRALQAKIPQQVLIATDDQRVYDACQKFGAQCKMTSTVHQSGTDRIAQAVADIDVDIVINLQADEPEIDAAYIDRLGQLLIDNPQVPMGTLISRFETIEQLNNPNIVKVVIDKDGRAMYFSRSVIPYDRSTNKTAKTGDYFRHLGIYGYRKDFLGVFTKLQPSFLENTEKLEQLRALENGYSILTVTVEKTWDGIDTAQQYEDFVRRIKQE